MYSNAATAGVTSTPACIVATLAANSTTDAAGETVMLPLMVDGVTPSNSNADAVTVTVWLDIPTVGSIAVYPNWAGDTGMTVMPPAMTLP